MTPPRGPATALGALVLLLVPAVSRACSECSCALPFPAATFASVETARTVRFGIEERLQSKDSATDEGFEKQREHRVSAFAIARPREGLVLLARMPWVNKRLEERVDDGPAAIDHAQGPGDLEVLARARVLSFGGSRAARGFVSAVGGFVAPTGRNGLVDASGEHLETHLQPGAGAWSGLAGVAAALPAGGSIVEVNLTGRWNGENGEGYRYGSALLYHATATSPALGAWRLMLGLDGRSAARDRVAADGTTDPNSGGSVLYIAPGVRVTPVPQLVLEAGAQVPVAESLFGVQDEHATARIALSLIP